MKTLLLSVHGSLNVLSCSFLTWILSVYVSMTVIIAGRSVERRTKYGHVRGFVDTLKGGQKVEKYLGIPYVKPPVGNLRFEAPQQPEPWEGILNAQQLPPACPQPEMGVSYIKMHVPSFNRSSEDCLYLNIYAPRRQHHQRRYTRNRRKHSLQDGGKERLAVLVFIHGGSYQNGMGAMMDGSHLATKGLVVVTFNYRLGPLGFLETNDDVFPGNYGLLDQIAALKWVQRNIHHFGGDRNRVTIDGHSAGGCSVGLLMLMPKAKGLFNRVIQQSGSPFAHWAVTRQPSVPNFYFKLFTSDLGCYGNGTAEVKACLKNIPGDRIQKAILEQKEHAVSLVPPYRPVVDGHVIPDIPERLAKFGDINGHQILTGSTTDEGLSAATPLLNNDVVGRHGLEKLQALLSCFRGDLPEISSIVERILEQYFRWPFDVSDEEIKEGFVEIVGDYFITAPTQYTVDTMAARNVTVFFYNYDYGSMLNYWEGRVNHGADLFYLSGYPLSGHKNFQYDDVDRSMASMLIHLWATFAKDGLPSLLPQQESFMPPYSRAKPVYTRMTSRNGQATLSFGSSFKADKMDFWNNQVPELYLNQVQKDRNLLLSYSDPDDNDPLITKMKGDDQRSDRAAHPYIRTVACGSWVLIAVCIALSVLTVLLSACYCQVKRKVNKLIRQTGIGSGSGIL